MTNDSIITNDSTLSNESTMSEELMLTTIDNPFNPFVDYNLWLLYDKEKGYDTSERLMRVAQQYMFEGMSQVEMDKAVDKAMDDLIEIDILNVFVKGTEKSIQKLIDQRKNNNFYEEEQENENITEKIEDIDQ